MAKKKPSKKIKFVYNVLTIIFCTSISYVFILNNYVSKHGIYSLGKIIDISNNPKGSAVVYYTYKVNDVEYSKKRQIPRFEKDPPIPSWFVLRYWEKNPNRNVHFYSIRIPDCFEYGSSNKSLNCNNE